MLKGTRSDRGSILMIVLILMIVIIGMTGAILGAATTHKRSTFAGQNLEHATAIAEAGIDDTVNGMNNWTSGNLTTNSGSLSTGSFSCVVTRVDVVPPIPGYSGVKVVGQSTYKLVSTGTLANGRKMLTAIVQATTNPFFVYGLFSNQSLDLSSNVMSDSFDSSLQNGDGSQKTYAQQATNTYNGTHYALLLGTDGSNHYVVEAAGDKIFGNLTPGPGYSTIVASNDYVSGTITPAATAVTFPPITVPEAPLMPSIAAPTLGNVTIPAGTYHYASITSSSNSTLNIVGPATIVVDNFNTSSNTQINIDTTNGPVKFYGTGAFSMNSNNALTPINNSSGHPVSQASDLQIYITTDNYTGYAGSSAGNPALPVGIHSNGSETAAIYAPNAVLTWASNTQLYGSAMAQVISPASNFSDHYDQSLSKLAFGPVIFKTKAWYENPADQ